MTTKSELLQMIDALKIAALALPSDGATTPPTPAPGNQAAAYGVQVLLATTAGVYWRCVSVVHLPPTQNRGRRGIYVQALEADGRRARDSRLRIGWGWKGQQAWEGIAPAPLDKQDGETGHGVVDLNSQEQVTTVWITGDGYPSDRVTGMHTKHPDERAPGGEIWNSQGHHSFVVIFQRTVP